MKAVRNLTFISLFLFFAIKSFAQDVSSAETEGGFMYENEKIFVVMAVAVIIVSGLFLYLFNLDKKISRLEKKGK